MKTDDMERSPFYAALDGIRFATRDLSLEATYGALMCFLLVVAEDNGHDLAFLKRTLTRFAKEHGEIQVKKKRK